MRKTLLGLALAATVAAPAAAAPGVGSTGPYVGRLTTGQTATHTYDNNPANNDCIQLAVPYDVTVRWAPGATLTLSTGDKSTTQSDGSATLTSTRGWCTSFGISVTSVSGDAAYVVTVTRGLAGIADPA